ncbi:MAG: hypothetical protein J0H54_13400 [Rhizobiales bacterium]|nr:hypothetical protein [Hyphomicrobiales bacterium]
MSDFTAADEALGSLVLIEEFFSLLAKSGTVPKAALADVVRSASARLATEDHFGASEAVQHYFEAWLRD